MQVFRVPSSGVFPGAGVLGIGTFDGWHLGHQTLARTVLRTAHHYGLPASLLTFYPNPGVALGRPVPQVFTHREKWRYAQSLGIQQLFIARFSDQLQELTPDQFVWKYLGAMLSVHHVVVGTDFHFGKNRSGNAVRFEQLLGQAGIGLDLVPMLLVGREIVSSSRVRALLQEGKFGMVRRMLGRTYRLSGWVVRGTQQARTLGFPTANVRLSAPMAVRGVFIGRVYAAGAWHPAVINVGMRPTFSRDLCWYLEAHLLDVEIDLYYEHITVEFMGRLRDEQHFETIAQLQTQIESDVFAAKLYFSQCVEVLDANRPS